MERILHYDISRQLGQGKNGPTYLAYDTGLQRPVVIKLLDSRPGVTQEWVEEFDHRTEPWLHLREAAFAHYLSVENVDSRWCVIRDYVDGQSLAELAGDSGLDYAKVLRVALAAAEALRGAHDRGLVHENITPSNIILEPGGEVRIVDHCLGPDTADIASGRLPAEDLVCLAPERFKGQVNTHLGDLYSLGVSLYRAFTGRYPWPLDNPSDLPACILEHPADLDSIPSGSRGEVARLLLAKMLAAEPSERFASAESLQTTLKGILALDTGEIEVIEEKRGFTSRQYLTVSVLVLLLIILWLIITTVPH